MSRFHVVTVGWPQILIEGLCAGIAARSIAQFSYIAHPRHAACDWTGGPAAGRIHFFRQTRRKDLPPADSMLLASLEQEGVPTMHNMILGDRVVCRLDYSDVARYATFIAKRLSDLYDELQPSVVIGGFDSLHGGLALAVAKRKDIPWFALHFSVIPPGLACLCDRMSPASRVQVKFQPRAELLALADSSLRQFESRSIKAHAYIAPPRSLRRAMFNFPSRLASLVRTIRMGRDRDFARFTEVETRYDVKAALRQIRRSQRAHAAAADVDAIAAPPASPYVLFGLHMQPESSIDVWAPFVSNQMWVIELLSRSIPPTHKLLVKIHKSDISNYSRSAFDRMRAFPGVELVRPTADSRDFIEKADLVVAIQGTMGLEAALLGRPVIMLGDSPVTVFPNAARMGAPDELPALVRRQLGQPQLRREEIIEAYASYLAPFLPASHNDWTRNVSGQEIESYVRLFEELEQYLAIGFGRRNATNERLHN
jgi:hypothetical protein